MACRVHTSQHSFSSWDPHTLSLSTAYDIPRTNTDCLSVPPTSLVQTQTVSQYRLRHPSYKHRLSLSTAYDIPCTNKSCLSVPPAIPLVPKNLSQYRVRAYASTGSKIDSRI
eukprot:2979218-Rhodomonas_salina.7